MKLIKLHISLLTLILFVCAFGFAQEKSNFTRLPGALSPNSIIIEDDLGYIWIKGEEGLIKYDGYNFNLLPYQTILSTDLKGDGGDQFDKDSQGNLWLSSIGGNLVRISKDGNYTSYQNAIDSCRIYSIKEINNSLWLGSSKGDLYKYDYNTENVEQITQLPKLKNKFQNIKTLAGYGSKTIWISTFLGKVYSYSLNSNTFSELIDPSLKLTQDVRLTTDKQGNLWIATELNGLLQYNPTTKKIIKRHGEILTNYGLSKYPMFIRIICDSSGIIWAPTDGDGLYKIDPSDNSVSIFKNNPKNRSSISNNTITNVYEDKNKNIWALSKKGEINILLKDNTSINYFSGSEDNTPTKILSLLKSEFDKSLWLGTDGKGLNRVFVNNSVINYDDSKKGGNYFPGKYIQSLLEDEIGNIWIATYQNGLWIYNRFSNTFSKIETRDKRGKSHLDIRYLFKDSKNRIWLSVGQSIQVYSSDRNKIATFDYNSNKLTGNYCKGISEDENGTIWLGISDGGLFEFHENKTNLSMSSFTNHDYIIDENDLSNYNIRSITPNYNGQLYISTSSGRLIKFDITKKEFESLSDKESLKNIDISSILYENPNKIWISSTKGIHQYQIETDSLKSYYLTDGLQSDNFTRRSSFKDSNGTLYFGGELGANSFYPIGIVKKETQTSLYINEIEILNKPAKFIIPDQLKTRIEDLQHINLNASQSSFSFQFSAIKNLINPNFEYEYRLNGFHENWINPAPGRVASYTNIPSGHYTFEVKARPKNGSWNLEPKKISIFISPPWWLSTIAFICYFIIAALGTYGIILWVMLKDKLAKGEWENQKEKELYGLKMNFFTKMSHEIQTPLTLILGPIEDMLSRADINGNQLLKQRLTIINNNAKRLSRIATELMTVRNKELGKLRIFASHNNIIEHLKNIVISFSEQARFKNIDFTQAYSHKEINFWYDRDKIEHVVYNLLSNAFKFTPREGSIKLDLQVDKEKETIEISITDSGPGIPKDELDAIFELFYQANLGLHSKGSGIGLALSQELIVLHNGEILVDSSPENGTCFAVRLSTKENNFSEDQKILTELNQSVLLSEKENHINFKENFKLKENIESNKKHTLLIVEDNVEMQMFLRDTLSNTYNLFIAENGKLGISLADKHHPDLIISDIMMPVMDGVEMCEILQKKKSTSHIPIIFLTAKNNSDGRLSGLKAGAIEYLKKPFNFYELLLKINNIIATKEKSVSKYKTDVISNPLIETSKSRDVLFMEKLIKELNSKIEDPEFKLEELSNLLNLSYSAIYRKCHDITGKTLVELVRTLKLKKAAYLIVKQGYNVSEAAFIVGYKDPKYFTKCFKEEFGKTPNYFKKESKNSDLEEFFDKYNLHSVD